MKLLNHSNNYPKKEFIEKEINVTVNPIDPSLYSQSKICFETFGKKNIPCLKWHYLIKVFMKKKLIKN